MNYWSTALALLFSSTAVRAEFVDVDRDLHLGSDHGNDKFYSLINAADYSHQEGTRIQRSSEGVRNIGFIDAGDSLSYHIDVPYDGQFLVQIRLSSLDGDGSFEIANRDTQEILVEETDELPQTGDWNRYATYQTSVVLEQGEMDLQIRAIEPGFNLLWVAVREVIPTLPPTHAPTMTHSPTTQPSDMPSNIPTLLPSSPPTQLPTRPPIIFPVEATGFVRAHSTAIVAPDGSELRFKGMALGGWMNMQPYLVIADKYVNSSTDFMRLLSDTMGPERTDQFRLAWLNNFVQREDIQELKSLGFNLVRVPMHYDLFTFSIEQEPIEGFDTWIQTGFDLVDRLLAWAAEEQIYVLLDLMAAPGGQGFDPATDYNITRPGLFESKENRRKTIALWQEIAFQYRDNPWIAGFDLLSQVDWNFAEENWEDFHYSGCDETENAPLREFYEDAISAIRQVDDNHMIILAGNCWGTNHRGLLPMRDNNIALGFHLFWTSTSVDAIQQYIQAREVHDVPMLMTQAGENHNKWYREAVELLDDYRIGWAWWTWKKMNSTSSPFEIYSSTSYNTLLSHWDYECVGIHVQSAYDSLMKLADNVRLSSTNRIRPVIEALMGTQRDCTSAAAYVVEERGVTRIEAEEYCRENGIATELAEDVDTIGLNVGWLAPGASISYRIDVDVEGSYRFRFRVASIDGDGGYRIVSNGVELGEIDTVPNTGGWQRWEYATATIQLPAGDQVITFVSTEAGWNLNWFEVSAL